MGRNEEMASSLVTVAEGAARLRIREGTLRFWLAQRRLPFVRVGRGVRIPSNAIDGFIAANTVPAAREVGRGWGSSWRVFREHPQVAQAILGAPTTSLVVERGSAQPASRAATLGRVEGLSRTYVSLPEAAYLPVAIGGVASHILSIFDIFPYLVVLSPVRRVPGPDGLDCGRLPLLQETTRGDPMTGLPALVGNSWNWATPHHAALPQVRRRETR